MFHELLVKDLTETALKGFQGLGFRAHGIGFRA